MKTKIYYAITLLIILLCSMNKTYSQASSANGTNSPLYSYDYLGWTSGTNRPLIINNNDDHPINFLTNNTPRARITHDGLFGIGDYSSFTIAHLLDVNKGDINIFDGSFPNCQHGYMIDGQYMLWHNGVQSRLYVGINAGNNGASGSYNTCVGYGSGNALTSGENNTFVGTKAGTNISTGQWNTVLGVEALMGQSSCVGNFNTAVGYYTLRNITNAIYNTALGYGALRNNTAGDGNVAIGSLALASNTSGGFVIGTPPNYFNPSTNNAIGFAALYSNTSGGGNNAIGRQALYYNTIGYNNVANGDVTLVHNTTGSANTAIGFGTLSSNTVEKGNTALGATANVINGFSFSTAIGYGATALGDHEIQLGTILENVFQNSHSFVWSDGRFKFNINDDVKGLDFIKLLRPVTYQMNGEKLDNFVTKDMNDTIKANRNEGIDYTAATAKVHSGFIAQQVDSAAKVSGFNSSIVYIPSDTSTGTYALAYAEIVVPLVKAVQELDAKSGSDYDFLLSGSDRNPTTAADIDSIKYTRGYLQLNTSSLTPKAVLEVQNKSSIANFNNTGAAAFLTDATNFSFPIDTNNYVSLSMPEKR